MKAKRIGVTAAIVIICYLLQCTLFPHLALASIKPNRGIRLYERSKRRNAGRFFLRPDD